MLDVEGDARDFIDEYKLTYPQLNDRDGARRQEVRRRRSTRRRFVIDRQGRIAAVQRGPVDDAVHARRTSSRCCEDAREAPARRCSRCALLAPAAAALAADCPQTTLGDVEDEVMCPVCGVPLGLATEAPQAAARARLHPAPDRRSASRRRRSRTRSSPSSAIACSPCRRRRRASTSCRLRRCRPWSSLGGIGGDHDGRAARRRRGAARARPTAARSRRSPATTPRASTPTWSATTCDLARSQHGVNTTSSPPSASASCRSSRPACCRSCPATCRRSRASRSPRSRRASERAAGARARAALLPLVHRDVRRARHDRDRPRPDAAGAPRDRCARSPAS